MKKDKPGRPFADQSELEEILGVPGDRLRERVRRGNARGGLLTSKDLFGEIITELGDRRGEEPHTQEDLTPPPSAREEPDPDSDGDPITRKLPVLTSLPPPPENAETALHRPPEASPPASPRRGESPLKTPSSEYSLLDLAYSTLLKDPNLAAPAKPGTSSGAPDGLSDYGQYTLLERIATGGMAEVFRAKLKGVEGFEKVVAIKRILPHLSSNKDFVEMFINEAKMAARLSHPNIAQIFELGKIEDSYFIAMEHVDGRDLRAILAEAREKRMGISVDLSALIVSRVSSALGHAHRQKDAAGRELKLVHRDISPQNILISYDGEVKLVDFGIAKAAVKAPITDSGALRGKLLYMSPEQAWGRAIDNRSDIFALGVVFFELLTGHCPFMSSSELSILEMVRRATIPPPSTLNPVLPGQLEAVVLKALRKAPEDRYQDAGEMLHDLETYLRGRPAVRSADLALVMSGLFRPASTEPAGRKDTDPAAKV